jgi:hypothetical protein
MSNLGQDGLKIGLFLSTRITKGIRTSEPAELLALYKGGRSERVSMLRGKEVLFSHVRD